MSPLWGQIVGVISLVLMLVFIGIWVWAWLPHHKRDFDALSRLPMLDDREPTHREVAP